MPNAHLQNDVDRWRPRMQMEASHWLKIMDDGKVFNYSPTVAFERIVHFRLRRRRGAGFGGNNKRREVCFDKYYPTTIFKYLSSTVNCILHSVFCCIAEGL